MFTADRPDIKQALDTVDGVTGYLEPPTALKPGDAWPVWAGAARGPGHAWSSSWRVLVVLAPDERSATAALGPIAEQVIEALEGLLYIDQVNPVDVPTQVGTVLALELRGDSE